jgi:uncharacterized protein YrrD
MLTYALPAEGKKKSFASTRGIFFDLTTGKLVFRLNSAQIRKAACACYPKQNSP